MAKASKSTKRRSGSGPSIARVLRASGDRPGRVARRVRAGEVLRIEGTGFGRRAGGVGVLFDHTKVAPYAVGFCSTELLVAAPLLAKTSHTLAVRVGRRTSAEVPLTVTRPSRRKAPPGAEAKRLIDGLDEYAAHVAALGRWVASELPAGPEVPALLHAARSIDGLRGALQRTFEINMTWIPLQANQTYEALRTIELYDEMVASAELVDRTHELTNAGFGPGSAVDGLVAGGAGALFSRSAARAQSESEPGMFESTIGTIGFIVHEGAKVLEGFEHFLKILQPSIEAGGDAGVGIEVGADADVSVSMGEGVSALAKIVDVIAQIMMRIGDSDIAAALQTLIVDIQTDVQKLETKADGQGTTLDDITTTLDDHTQDLSKLEEKAERTQADLGDALNMLVNHGDQLIQLEEKADRQEEAIGRIEEKGDRLEEAVGYLEEKGDRQEEKLDRLEQKADGHEVKLDRLEEKADQAEEKLDRLEEKADKAEEKLDRVADELERQETKLDRLEDKADRQETKLDRLEGKADRQETKLDRLEGKADRLETKLDILEGKADREEEKLDRLPIVLPPQEGSIADQRGGGDRVTAAVAAVQAPNLDVFVRAAIRVTRSELTDLTSWSPWVSFGRPQTNTATISVSIDLQYRDGSDTLIDGLLTARDGLGRVFVRVYQGPSDSELLDVAQWSDWDAFLGQP